VQKLFFEITSGEREAPGDWLTFVNERKASAAASPAESNGHNAAQARPAKNAQAPGARDAIHVTLTE